MRKLQVATNLLTRFILILIFTAQLLDRTLALSDKRLCADENCKKIIGTGVGLVTYHAREEGMVSFQKNSAIRIKSKSAGNDETLWGVEVNGREGYAPKKFIQVTKVLIPDKKLVYLVDVKPVNAEHILTTSEKPVEQKNTIDTVTTNALNVVPTESTDKPLLDNSDEGFTTETVTAATPVLSETVDGTRIPVVINDLDGVVQNLQEIKKEENVSASKVLKQDFITTVTKMNDGHFTAVGDQSLKEVENNIEKGSDEKKELYLGKVENNEFDSGNVSPESFSTNNTLEKDSVEKSTEYQAETNTIIDSGNVFSENFNTDNSFEKDSVEKSEYQAENNRSEQPQISEVVENKISTQNEEISDSSDKHETNEEHDILNDAVDNSINNKLNSEEFMAQNTTESAKESDAISNDRHENNVINDKFGNENTKGLEVPENEKQKTSNISEENSLENQENGVEANASENSPSLEVSKNNLREHEISESSVEHETNKKQDNSNDSAEKPTENRVNSKQEHGSNSLDIKTEFLTSQNSGEQLDTVNENQINTEGVNENNGNSQDQYENDVDEPKDSENLQENSVRNEENKLAETDKSEQVENNIKNVTQITNNQDDSVNNELLEPALNDNVINDISLQHKKTSNSKDVNHLIDLQTEANASEELQSSEIKQSRNDNLNSLHTDQTELPSDKNENQITEPAVTVSAITTETQEIVETSGDNLQNNFEAKMNEHASLEDQTVLENITPTPYSPYNDIPSTTPSSSSQYDYTNQQSTVTDIPPNDYYTQQYEGANTKSSQQNFDRLEEQTTISYNSISTAMPETASNLLEKKDDPLKSLPSSTPHFDEMKENKGLFATIMGTVNNVLSINKRNKYNEQADVEELDRILFSNSNSHKIKKLNAEETVQYCKQIGPNGDCPESEQNHQLPRSAHFHQPSSTKSIFSSDLTFDTFLKALAAKILEISELLAFLVIVAAASLFFIFGYYCFCNSSREGALLSKLNQLESSLLASHKENAILKHNLMSTKQKLTSIEDNSFGSNDMVVSLKKELEEELMEKARLQEQITVLQKELENAADAGIELNKIVSELLSNQTGDESIISSVEELQKQLNEQQNTILEINASLAEKSRENSELQLLIAEQNARHESELANLQRDYDELEQEKGNILTRLDELKYDFDKDITAALEGKNLEIKRLQNETLDLTNKLENEHTKWQTSVAKVEALEECLKNVRKDPNVNIAEVIDVANVKAQLIDIQKKYKALKERLEIESDAKKLAENQLQMISAEVEKLKQDFNQSEKDKLEAQTRLEVLSNYFKDKENQLQKELSLKEAMWLKQQGETTTTVDRVTAMQEEIQSLKSQNDSLRAEVEAQVAAHKAQIGTLENRAHETWLAARQSDRRYEEARAEATALRRQLTALAGGNVNEGNKTSAVTAGLGDELTQVPSPIHMESPGSPMLGRMPPPPFLPPPFMGPPPPFMGMPPPPPFVPPGEMRPAPLGRIMSPPPQRSGRFSPQHLDYEDYLDYEGNNTWHRHTYSPPPRTYRSLSPTDSRYNYGTERDLMSTYDTETDFSPPPSPRESRRRGGHSNERIDYNTNSSYGNTKKFNSGNKGPLSSGSEKSFNTPSHHDTKTKKGNTSGSGKNLV